MLFKKLLVQSGKITLFLTALCLVIYAGQMLGFEESIMAAFHYPAYADQDYQIWRYIAHSLVHLSNLHILFNLSWFWVFGGMIEQIFGSRKLLLLYLVSAVVTGYVQNAVSGPAFFGLSGVVYAVLGYVFIRDRFNKQWFNLPEGFLTMLLLGIAVGFISPFFGVEMGNAAHISGLVLGVVWGFFDSKIFVNRIQ